MLSLRIDLGANKKERSDTDSEDSRNSITIQLMRANVKDHTTFYFYKFHLLRIASMENKIQFHFKFKKQIINYLFIIKKRI
jgi:hypothetical protein